jgi:hypothetical protein
LLSFLSCALYVAELYDEDGDPCITRAEGTIPQIWVWWVPNSVWAGLTCREACNPVVHAIAYNPPPPACALSFCLPYSLLPPQLVLEVVLAVCFAADYVLHFYIADRKLSYIFSFNAIVDVVTILPVRGSRLARNRSTLPSPFALPL